MKSLLMVCNLHPRKLGAFEAYLARLGERCRAGGVRCGVLFSGEPIAPVAAALWGAGVEWWAAPDWNDAADRERRGAFVGAFLGVLRRGPWDFAGFQFCHELSVASALVRARWLGLAPAATAWVQQSGMVMPGRLGRVLSRVRVLARFVDGMVVLAPAAAEAVRARGWLEGRTRVIGNGCVIPGEPELRTGRGRAALGLPPDAWLAVAVGSLIERKGYDVLLPALAPLLQAEARRHLAIAGDGDLREGLVARATELGVGPQVHFLGLRDDVPLLLADADCFVQSSRAEGLSFALVEAMAAALPVVVTDVGGHRAVVTPETGWLVPPGDAGAFRAAVAAVLACPEVARRVGAAARALVAREYSVERQVDEQFAYFQSLVAGRRPAPRTQEVTR